MAKIVLTRGQRRQRRAERREKQRQANLGRARKMHTARLGEHRAEYVIAPLDSAPQTTKRQQFYIGCSGWFYWHWRGRFYSADLPTGKWFKHYQTKFSTVELNAPFYSWPTIATVHGWVRQVRRRNFIYTIKVCELITHIKRFAGTKILVRDFGFIADMLGPRMGCFLFQLPPSFHYTPSRLKRILNQLDHNRRNVLEFRHKSWWNEDVYATLRQTGTIFCSCSAPQLPDDLVKTADDIYVRFHGRKRWYRHHYAKEELREWADRIVASDAKRVWIYFNNDFEGSAPINAGELNRLLMTIKRPPARN